MGWSMARGESRLAQGWDAAASKNRRISSMESRLTGDWPWGVACMFRYCADDRLSPRRLTRISASRWLRGG